MKRLGHIVNTFEETAIAVLLGAMTLITFANVVLRYGFGSSLLWGLEATTILFAWLVLFGMSYGVKVTAHLGVDAVTNLVSHPVRRVMLGLSCLVCLAYGMLLMKGGWDYYANFANLPQTTGRWFPTGLQDMRIQDFRGFKPTVQIPIPEWSRGALEGWLLLDGDDPFEKLPVAIPYMIVPIGMALLLFRFVQAALQIVQGTRQSLIVSHEAEDAVEEVSTLNRDA